jgi:hypothetical protein
MINALLNLNAENNGGKKMKLRTWPWGKVGKRLGGSRSADGVIIDLPDGRSRNGSNVVAKFIFAQDSTDIKRAKQEYIIGNMMSKAGVGPKVFDYYEMRIPYTVNIENLMKKSSGSNSVNLFNSNVNTKSFRYCIVIIMENLYKGPGVVDTYTIAEGYKAKKPIPFEKIRAIIDKMHNLGVIHADMHQNNIMIQKIKKRIGYTYRPLIIDFGRSLKTNKSFKTNANANAYAKMNRYKNQLWWYSNEPNVMPVLLNGNGWMLAKQMNRRAPKGPGLMTRIKKRFAKKVIVPDNIKQLNSNNRNTVWNKYYRIKTHYNNNTPIDTLIRQIILLYKTDVVNSENHTNFNRLFKQLTKNNLNNTAATLYKGLSKLSRQNLIALRAKYSV